MKGRASIEIIKLLLAVCVGFSIRLFMDVPGRTSSLDGCPPCKTYTLNPDQDLLGSDGQFQLREPYKPHNRHDVIRYQYFNSSQMYDNFDDKPKAGLVGHRKADVKDILAQAMASHNTAISKQWVMKRLVNGYRRFDPLRGEEYILDIEIAQKVDTTQIPKPLTPPITETKRFHMVKPLNTVQTLAIRNIVDSKMIHFILPISSDVGSARLETFMKNFEKMCLVDKEHCFLFVIMFCGKSEREQKKAQDIKERVEGLRLTFRGSHIRFIQTSKKFNRALGLDLGAKQLPSEALMFFCDIDIIFTKQFIGRCRQNAVVNQQVYYPVVFAQHNPDLVRQYSPAAEVRNLTVTDINVHTGHWVHYGFGMVCLYAIDYRSVGGFTIITNKGWGGEDVELFEKHVSSKLSIFRAMEPGVIHLYHEKLCPPGLPKDKLRMCHGSQLAGYGSKSQLAAKLLLPENSL